jgi:MATE family multidrug resistance protein
MTPLRREIFSISRLAGPVIATQVGTILMGVVDTLMVSRVSTEALGAAAIGNVWAHVTLFCATGVILGIDPIVSQAHGARDGERAALALQRGVVLALLISLPVLLAFGFTGPVLTVIGQDPALAEAAHDYMMVQLPSIPCVLLFTAVRQYLQGRTLVRPAMYVMLLANVVNVVANWALIFGHLGFPALGLLGAGIATSVVRICMLGGLLVWVRVARLHEGAWRPWSRAALDRAGLRHVLALGVPVFVQLSLEIWAFSGSTLLAGYLGVTALAGHTIVLNVASLSFMVPLGISIAASTRVGNLIGGGDSGGVQRAARVAFVMGGGVMALAGLALLLLRRELAELYTPDEAVIAVCVAVLPIAAAFQIFDGLQVVACGVLRGIGRTRPAAWANLVGYWVLALPLGAWLAFRTDAGVPGIWLGLAAGLALVATTLVTWVLRGVAPAGVLVPESGGTSGERLSSRSPRGKARSARR